LSGSLTPESTIENVDGRDEPGHRVAVKKLKLFHMKLIRSLHRRKLVVDPFELIAPTAQ
jgi:hypothetical protein